MDGWMDSNESVAGLQKALNPAKRAAFSCKQGRCAERWHGFMMAHVMLARLMLHAVPGLTALDTAQTFVSVT